MDNFTPKKIAIVANGAIHDYQKIAASIKGYPYVIAADGGLINCDAMGIVPHLIVGDMDSVPLALLAKYEHIPQKRLSRDKDQTDVEIAIETVYSTHVERISLFAALEKRTDHTLYNLHLLHRYPEKLAIESEYETLFVVQNDVEIPCKKGQTISLIPLGQTASGISTKGLKWELHNAAFNHTFMSISNICLQDKVKIIIEHGSLICCLSKE